MYPACACGYSYLLLAISERVVGGSPGCPSSVNIRTVSARNKSVPPCNALVILIECLQNMYNVVSSKCDFVHIVLNCPMVVQ